MKILCTGAAGFVGSHVVDALLARGDTVLAVDNLSTGRMANVAKYVTGHRFMFWGSDVRDLPRMTGMLRDVDAVVHLASNVDNTDPTLTRADLDNSTIATWTLLEEMRLLHCKRIIYSSSASVYGDSPEPRTEEDTTQLPVSLYAAGKLAAEAMISAYSECFGIEATIFRFGNVVGSRLTHGVHRALLTRLQSKPEALRVLGDGGQERPFLHVSDVVRAILSAADANPIGCHVYNLSPADTTTVAMVAQHCVEASPYPETPIEYAGGEVGWKGDVRAVDLDPWKAHCELGWSVSMNSAAASARAAAELSSEVFG